jgi:high mobility group protein B1/high mobility group protein B2/high mobility group protein B3
MALQQPKKPVGGAYGIFLSEKRPEFSKACEGQRASAISTMAGEAWKKLSAAAKAPYQKKYEVTKAAYDKDIAAFLAAGGQIAKGLRALRTEKRKGGKQKKDRDPNKPKKPTGGAFGVFLSENRAKIVKSLPEGHKITDVTKAAAAQWKALSDAARKPYETAYVKKAEEFKIAMEEYNASNPGDDEKGEEEAQDDDEDEGEDEEPEAEKQQTKRPAVAANGEAAKQQQTKRPAAAADGSAAPPGKRGKAGKK